MRCVRVACVAAVASGAGGAVERNAASAVRDAGAGAGARMGSRRSVSFEARIVTPAPTTTSAAMAAAAAIGRPAAPGAGSGMSARGRRVGKPIAPSATVVRDRSSPGGTGTGSER